MKMGNGTPEFRNRRRIACSNPEISERPDGIAQRQSKIETIITITNLNNSCLKIKNGG